MKFVTRAEVTPGTASSWVTVDLSSHIPADDQGSVAGVQLRIVNNSATEYSWGVRHPSSTDTLTAVVEDAGWTVAFAPVNGSDECQIWVGHTTDVDVYIEGYFLASGAEFFTNAVDLGTPSAVDTWEQVDISTHTSQTAKIALVLLRNEHTESDPVGLRMNGSTLGAAVRSSLFTGDQRGAAIPVDANEIFERYASLDVDVGRMYLVGYLYKGVTNTYPDGGNGGSRYVVGSTGVYEQEDVSGDLGGDDVGVLIGSYTSGVSSDTEHTHNLRRNGDADDIYFDVSNFQHAFVEVDGSGVLEQKASSTDRGFYVFASVGAVDATAPSLTNATASQPKTGELQGSVDTDEANGTLYWVITTSSTAPSVAQIQAGQDHNGDAAPGSGSQGVGSTGTQTFNVIQPASGVQYWFHFQHQDAAGNDSAVVTSGSVTTGALANLPVPPASTFSLDTADVLLPGSAGSWDERLPHGTPGPVLEKDGTYYMYYIGAAGDRADDGGPKDRKVGVATASSLSGPWSKSASNPLIAHQPNGNVEEGIWRLAGLVDTDGTICLYVSTLTEQSESADLVHADITLYTSQDGVNFTEVGDVVPHDDTTFPGDDELGVLGAWRSADGTYYLYYTAKWDPAQTQWTLSLASGPDRDNFTSGQELSTTNEFGHGTDPAVKGDSNLVVFMGDNNGDFFAYIVPRSAPSSLGSKQETYTGLSSDQFAFALDRATSKWYGFFTSGTQGDATGVDLYTATAAAIDNARLADMGFCRGRSQYGPGRLPVPDGTID